MADCTQFQEKLDTYKYNSRTLYDRAETFKNKIIRDGQGTGTVDQIREAGRQLQITADAAAKLAAQFTNLVNTAGAAGCTKIANEAQGWITEANLISQNNSAWLQSNLERFVQEAQKRADITQQATTTKDNAGTGQPGTAGKGATATPNTEELQEVSVTAKKNPAQLEEVQVTGVKKDTTGLDEVKVTGKKNPDALSEVQVTGKKNPDELQEVTVTGKKNTNTGVAPQIRKAQAQASLQDATNFGEAKDWRVRLALAPGANYLYKAQDPGILSPLAVSQGVIFPYTPTINVNYNANYQQTSVVHSNYKILQYENSSVDSITIGCDFTAQDTFEANYLLAVIHFFRAATKMFYGQDENPKPGTPPPLVFLFGMGQFQFNAHPLVITSFSYNLPADVDYIRAGVAGKASGANAVTAQSPQKALSLGSIVQNKIQNAISSGIAKIGNRIGLNLTAGGGLAGPSFSPSFNPLNPVSVSDPTYVPTKINLSISCMPIISRNNVSNNFSFKDYANGKLLQGVRNPSGGFW